MLGQLTLALPQILRINLYLVLAINTYWPTTVFGWLLQDPVLIEDSLFSSSQAVQITLTADFQKLMLDRGEERGYHKAKLSYLQAEDTVTRSVKLKTRGNFRRDPANCKYPPIKVKFGKTNSEDRLFSDQKQLKLVIQCQLEKYVLLEYLAYRIYNVLTDSSYRVRLAQITYVDKEFSKVYGTKYGFFIESADQLQSRLGVEKYKKNAVQYFVERKHMITLALFQYMIGNTDWFVTSQHNISIFEAEGQSDLMAVPYDFDWSKLVDAEYTKPEGVPDHLLKERRLYKGLCMTKVDLEKQRVLFNSKKDEIRALINNIPMLSGKERKQTLAYIDQFYKTVNKKSSLDAVFKKEECVIEQNVSGRKKPD